MGAALVVTLVTGVDYVVRAVRLIQKPAYASADIGGSSRRVGRWRGRSGRP